MNFQKDIQASIFVHPFLWRTSLTLSCKQVGSMKYEDDLEQLCSLISGTSFFFLSCTSVTILCINLQGFLKVHSNKFMQDQN